MNNNGSRVIFLHHPIFHCFWKIAKTEKLKPLEVELRRLEDLSESIVSAFAYMKKREEEMRDTNGMLIGISLRSSRFNWYWAVTVK